MPNTAHMLSLLRFASALLLLQHGTGKLLGFPTLANVPAAMSPSWFAGTFELVGGALLLIGLATRPVAFVLAGMTAVAYFGWHASRSFFPILNGGELAALYCFVFLYLAFAGPGPVAVDAVLKRKGTAPAWF